MSRKEDEYRTKKRYRLKKELNLEYTYEAYAFTFGEEAIKFQTDIYQERVLLGQDLNISLDEVNKEFEKAIYENKLKRQENERVPIQDPYKKEVDAWYYKNALHKVVRNKSETDDIKVLSYKIKEAWDDLCNNSKRIQDYTIQKEQELNFLLINKRNF